MNPDTVAAFLSAIAAVASAVAAVMSYKLAKSVETRAVDDERRRLAHDIDKTAHLIDVEARRGQSIYSRNRDLQINEAVFLNATDGSAHKQVLSATDKMLKRIADIKKDAHGVADVSPGKF